MRNFIIATLLIFTSSAVTANEIAIPLHGFNCNLSTPPATAGENGLHGLIMKIHPRKSEMSATYSGCQITWLEQGPQWKKIFVAYFERGTLKVFWAYDDQSPNGTVCAYNKGKLTTKPSSGCIEYERIKNPAESFPPGCMQAMKAGHPLAKSCALNEKEH